MSLLGGTDRDQKRHGHLLRVLQAGGQADRRLGAHTVTAREHLAPNFDSLVGSGKPVTVSQGELFRVEAGLALGALVLVAAVHRRWTALLALVVALGGAAAVLVYRYVDVGALGPLPNMYDSFWYAEKSWSAVAVAEGVAAVCAGLLVLVELRPRAGSR